ncbi:tumor necrosis factor ligand superfamily member 9 [Aquarana catesbeiana]|uniref:tumor necrosis factor ligand superfamily member 9 n=1 Tax=Aquarana catesbeiana TaxID=8400 RepID=UPI003CCA694F
MTIILHPVSSEDLENQKTSPRTCRCLDYCLVISMVLLTMVVGSMGVFYMTWERPHMEKSTSERIQRDRLRNSAQLTIDSAQIADKGIHWNTNNLEGTFLGQDFSYDNTTQELLVKNEGYYYIYSQITLKCVSKNNCSNEHVSLSVLKNNQDSILKLHIYVGQNSKLSSFSANIQYISANTKLNAQFETSGEITDWQLDENSFMGLFLFSEYSLDELQSA